MSRGPGRWTIRSRCLRPLLAANRAFARVRLSAAKDRNLRTVRRKTNVYREQMAGHGWLGDLRRKPIPQRVAGTELAHRGDVRTLVKWVLLGTRAIGNSL